MRRDRRAQVKVCSPYGDAGICQTKRPGAGHRTKRYHTVRVPLRRMRADRRKAYCQTKWQSAAQAAVSAVDSHSYVARCRLTKATGDSRELTVDRAGIRSSVSWCWLSITSVTEDRLRVEWGEHGFDSLVTVGCRVMFGWRTPFCTRSQEAFAYVSYVPMPIAGYVTMPQTQTFSVIGNLLRGEALMPPPCGSRRDLKARQSIPDVNARSVPIGRDITHFPTP